MGDARREFEVLETAGNLAERVRRDLAVLGREVGSELVPVGLDKVPDPEHDLGALGQGGRAPAGEGRGGGGARGIDLGDGGEMALPCPLAGRRVVEGAASARRARDEATADPMVD